MPVNQGSGFNFNTSNPYAFQDWGGIGQAPVNSTRGIYAGPGGHLNFRYPSTVTYTSSSDGPIVVFGMHQRVPRYMAIASGTSVNGQLSAVQSPGGWFVWQSNGHTTVRLTGENQVSSSPLGYSASPTNPPFVITDFQASVPGGNAPGVKMYIYHGQNAQLMHQKGFAADSDQTWRVYHAGFDGGSNYSAWDFEPIASGNPYQFDQVTQF